MKNAIERRREVILEQLQAMHAARRGQISEQFYTRKTTDGRTVKQGPYYVWQRWVKGKKVSARIKREDVEKVKADIEKGHAVEDIFEAYFILLEEAAIANDQRGKKKSSPSRKPRAVKPRRSSR